MPAQRVCLAAAFALLAGTTAARAEAPDVVVSIKPLHALVASIMTGVGEPALLVEGAASPHTYSMKPSNAAALEKADIVFWMGHGMEHFLQKPLEALGTKATVVELEEAPGIARLPQREGGAFEPHDDEAHDDGAHDDGAHDDGAHNDEAHQHGGADHAEEEAGHHHDDGEFDMHAWLDPDNAKAMAAAIEATLSAKDPANAARYRENRDALGARIDAMDKAIVATLAPVKDRPFVVFHDAYQYFERHYGVRVAGSITVSPETMPGAKRLQAIHDKIETLGATCVFAEPQFEPRLIRVVTEGTKARSGTLDPEAGTLQPGPDLYVQMMQSLADSMRTCLSAEG